MNSTITIDGQTIEYEDARVAYGTYKVIAAIIRSGRSETVVENIVDGDYQIRHVFHVGPYTVLRAHLAYSPVEEIAPSLSAQTAEQLAVTYGEGDGLSNGG